MIFDCHSDIWTDVTIRRLKGEGNIIERYHLPKLREGNIEGAIFVIWVDPPHTDAPYHRAKEIMKAVADERRESSCIETVVDMHQLKKAREEGKFPILIGLEGLSSIGSDIDKIDEYYEFGARHAGLTWNEQNDLATGVRGDKDRGLTDVGRKAVRRIIDKGMLLDVSHLNEKSFWDLVEEADGYPVIASHSNARALCSAARNLTDEQLKVIGQAGGVVGMNAFRDFIDDDSECQDVEHLVNHLEHTVSLIGIEHVAFGFDFCDFLGQDSVSTFSTKSSSEAIGMENCSKTGSIIAEMKKRGFNDEDIKKISCKNIYRVMETVLK